MSAEHAHSADSPAIYGVIAEFDTPEAVLDAARKAYDAGYRNMDAYTPFPVHGLVEAMGVRRTWLPAIVLVAGVSGALGGFFLQVFGRSVHYPFLVGGREQFSWPAFIPVTFECGILLAAFAAVFGMLIMNGLPRPHHPVFNAKGFERASNDRFYFCIESSDTKFDPKDTGAFLKKLGALETQIVHE